MGREPGEFDQWYSNMDRSVSRDQIVRAALGLPPELDSSSLLPWDGLGEVIEALALAPGMIVADLACGRGGYGLETARRSGARLVGMDFSEVALELARQHAGRFGLGERATFQRGELAATGLAGQTADAVMCIDAVQFAEPSLDALRECLRVLAGGGRLAVTCWEALDPADERVPARLRQVDLARDLAAAGFARIEVREKPAWADAEQALWEAAAKVDPAGDRALESLRREATSVLGWLGSTRRVLATAVAPA